MRTKSAISKVLISILIIFILLIAFAWCAFQSLPFPLMGHIPSTPDPTDMYVAMQNAYARATEFAESTFRPIREPIMFDTGDYAIVEEGQHLSFNPQGSILAVMLNPYLPIHFINVSDGSVIGTLPVFSDLPIFGIAFNPDGSELIVNSCSIRGQGAYACLEHELSFWDTEELIKKDYSIGGSTWRNIVFSPDGSQMASHDYSKVEVWDAATRQSLFKIEAEQDDGSVYSFAFSPDGQHIAMGLLESIKIWDISTLPRRVAHINVPMEKSGIVHIAFSPDGTILCAATFNGVLYFWDTTTQSLSEGYIFFNSHSNFVFNPDGEYLIHGLYTNTLQIMRIRDTRSFEVPLDPFLSGNTIEELALSPDGNILAALSSNASLFFLDLREMSALTDE